MKRRGLIRGRHRRRPLTHPGRPSTVATAPNTLWTLDFKGHFRTRDGRDCYPLTLADDYRRYLLGCQALLQPTRGLVRPVLTRLFQEYGLPERIRTANGAPFASCALARLSRLSVWFLQCGIHAELIEPGHPEQNPRHERMHRTLKAATTRPPGATLALSSAASIPSARSSTRSGRTKVSACSRPRPAITRRLGPIADRPRGDGAG